MVARSLGDLLDPYRQQGDRQYDGEAVSQLAHALQCADLAATAGQPATLVTACFFHDLGHLLAGPMLAAGVGGDRHEYRALPWLTPLFPEAVTRPIQLHVAAKRYLCAAEPSYYDALSPASQATLTQQGGPFSPSAAAAFIQQPYAVEAVQLRRWDDGAKVPDRPTPGLDFFLPMFQAALG